MKESFTSFLFKLLGLTIVLYGLSFFLFTRLIIMPAMPVELMLIVLFAITALSHFIVVKMGEKDAQVFTRSYMGISTGRLMLYSIFIFAYCLVHKDIAKFFVLTFFVYYIIYTFFEVRSVQAYLKK